MDDLVCARPMSWVVFGRVRVLGGCDQDFISRGGGDARSAAGESNTALFRRFLRPQGGRVLGKARLVAHREGGNTVRLAGK